MPLSLPEWVRELNRISHDANHMQEPEDCAVCRSLMVEFGPMPDHLDLIWAQQRGSRPVPISRYSKVPIPEALRWEVWERDNFTCQECGTRRFLSIDHIVPESKGGTLDPANLRTLCRLCNSKKGDR